MKDERRGALKAFYPLDLFGYANQLTDGEFAVLKRLRTFLETKLQPELADLWERAEFPYRLLTDFVATGVMDDPVLFEETASPYKTREIFTFFRDFELAKVDPSFTTFIGVHGGLYLNTLLALADEEQLERWAKPAMTMATQGCFALTEPEHGSDISGGLATTAEKIDDEWVINGEKRWIGGANTADEIAVFARDLTDGQVKAFIVPRTAPGITIEVIPQKIALRILQNTNITFDNVVIDEDRLLTKSRSFKDISKILGVTRSEVGHMATGAAAGALEAAQRYVKSREQFGKPLGSFQLVQAKLATMQANVTACMSYSVGIAQIQEAGIYEDVNSSLTKMHNALRLRETVALAREVCGGNGIVLENDVARFFADAEGIYSYEGTHEMNALIVGRKLTGYPAFV